MISPILLPVSLLFNSCSREVNVKPAKELHSKDACPCTVTGGGIISGGQAYEAIGVRGIAIPLATHQANSFGGTPARLAPKVIADNPIRKFVITSRAILKSVGTTLKDKSQHFLCHPLSCPYAVPIL